MPTLARGEASKGVPRDPEGTFTRETPEADPCLPQVAVEACGPEERLVSSRRGWWVEAGESGKRPLEQHPPVQEGCYYRPAT